MFGILVRMRRERAGWTQQSLASVLLGKGLAVDAPAVSRIESGLRDLRLSEAEIVASAFGDSLVEFLGGIPGSGDWALERLARIERIVRGES